MITRGKNMNEHKSYTSESIDLELLKRFFRDKCSKKEEKKVIEYFLDVAYEKVLKYKLKEHWKEFEVPLETNVDSEKILDKIYHKMHSAAWEKSKKMHLMKKMYHQFSRIAAVLFFPVVLFLGWYLHNKMQANTDQISYAEIYSPLGARTHFELPDGSSGWLNSDSKLKFPSNFSGSKREVFLRGEGYFDVVSMPQKPFVVNIGNSNIVALGTSFNVMAWPEEEEIIVTMESGLTEIKRVDENNRTIHMTNLKAGEQLSFYSNSYEIKKREVVTQFYTSWKDGKLVFRNESMTDILKKLGRWYNVEFVIKGDVIEEYQYRATFKDETLDEVLKLLEHTSPIGHRELKRVVLSDGTYSRKKIELFNK